MPDFLSRRERSALMSRIRGKNTGIELLLFGVLRKEGIRFRRHHRDLPGSPDAAILDRKIAIFVDGDFWHGRNFSRWRNTLAPVWREKIECNIARDRSRRRKLRRMGWKVLRVWGKDLLRNRAVCVKKLQEILTKQ